MVARLEEAGHLRSGLTFDDAADIFYVLVNEEVFSLLVDDCGWDIERFRTWLTGALGSQLLDPSPGP